VRRRFTSIPSSFQGWCACVTVFHTSKTQYQMITIPLLWLSFLC
jgi:hypothetical protein